ncbi:MAG TPA: 1-deoxy-D-xylulose-5-phosphate reductoisomerase [Firmicutes bacterium]|mgnify:CR=1 FL=1|nr:1-deoxy-D-xylulose-5-phosphate reductoisomerase [Bacillota bacterium]
MNKRKLNLSILGSTGSIGRQALEVVDDLERLGEMSINIVGISGNHNIDLLEEQIRKYKPEIAAAADEKTAEALKIRVADTGCKVLGGESGLIEVARAERSEMVLASIVGFAGLRPTFAAVEAGKDIALANKETLVAAGDIFMQSVEKNNVRLLPVDSEHSAIFQCLRGGAHSEISKILLTASGGSFFGKTREELSGVTKEDALKHPNWNMGAKVTIDSATLMNKGLEVIEAHHLFGVDIDDIEVVVQRESVIHSMVEFKDLSVIAQLSLPSMKHPIQYAFTYPERLASADERLDFSKLKSLSFYRPDESTFRCLALAKRAGKLGGIMPTVMNAANERAVELFMHDKIKFLDIADIVEEQMEKYKGMNRSAPDIEYIFEIDEEARRCR